jgi:threonine/homoserine/homoserine lactone efflux protein
MHAFLSFLAVAAVAMVVPGPDTFVVLRTSLSDGPRAGTWAAAGSATGNLVWGALSVLGVAALLAASAAAFSTLKLAGAAYLAVLGLQALRAAWRGEPLARTRASRAAVSRTAAFRRGLASDLLNVKAGLFWTALVPQFLTAGSALLPVAMITAMVGLVFAWLTGYAHLAGRLSTTLESRRAARAVNGGVGAVLLALGGGLALARH